MSSLQASAFSLLPTVAVTGAAGFIGRRVVARLGLAGARVVGIDRKEMPADWPAGAVYRRLELGGDMPRPDGDWILVHLAWSMDRGDEVAQAASVMDFARLLGQEGLVGAVGLGSAEEYGERSGCLKESQAPGAHLSAYGRAKHLASRAIRAWAKVSGKPAVWLRPFVAYGPGQQGRMAIPYALQCARERRPADFSEGLQMRDLVHVDDVADAIVRAAQRLPEWDGVQAVCNLGRGEPVRLRDVLERVAVRTGAVDLFRYGTRSMREHEPMVQVADVSEAERLLGWRAQISWEQGIDHLCAEPGEKDRHA